MFSIDKDDPTHPSLVGKPADTLGEFPSTVAYSSRIKTGSFRIITAIPLYNADTFSLCHEWRCSRWHNLLLHRPCERAQTPRRPSTYRARSNNTTCRSSWHSVRPRLQSVLNRPHCSSKRQWKRSRIHLRLPSSP